MRNFIYLCLISFWVLMRLNSFITWNLGISYFKSYSRTSLVVQWLAVQAPSSYSAHCPWSNPGLFGSNGPLSMSSSSSWMKEPSVFLPWIVEYMDWGAGGEAAFRLLMPWMPLTWWLRAVLPLELLEANRTHSLLFQISLHTDLLFSQSVPSYQMLNAVLVF